MPTVRLRDRSPVAVSASLHAGQAHEGLPGARTERHTQACRFGQATRDQRRARSEPQPSPSQMPAARAIDVLHRAADLDAYDVGARIDAQVAAMQLARNGGGEAVAGRQGQCDRQSARDLGGKARP